MKWQQYKNTNEEDQKSKIYQTDTPSIISYDHDIINTLDQSNQDTRIRRKSQNTKLKNDSLAKILKARWPRLLK